MENSLLIKIERSKINLFKLYVTHWITCLKEAQYTSAASTQAVYLSLCMTK